MKNDFRDYICHSAEEELYHFGILGMKWGVRRYQNPDGSLTEAGQKRYLKSKRFREKMSNNKSFQDYQKRKNEENIKNQRKAKEEFDKDLKSHVKNVRTQLKEMGWDLKPKEKPVYDAGCDYYGNTYATFYYTTRDGQHLVIAEYDPKTKKVYNTAREY